MHEDVSSRTRRRSLAASAVGGTFLFLLLAGASYAQTVQTADARAFVTSFAAPGTERRDPSSIQIAPLVHKLATVPARMADRMFTVNQTRFRLSKTTPD